MLGFGIGGACVMRLASALTSKFSKHARMTADVAIVFFSLLNLELRRLVIKAFLKFTFCFCGGEWRFHLHFDLAERRSTRVQAGV